jgi:hypothetical protein
LKVLTRSIKDQLTARTRHHVQRPKNLKVPTRSIKDHMNAPTRSSKDQLTTRTRHHVLRPNTLKTLTRSIKDHMSAPYRSSKGQLISHTRNRVQRPNILNHLRSTHPLSLRVVASKAYDSLSNPHPLYLLYILMLLQWPSLSKVASLSDHVAVLDPNYLQELQRLL